MSRKYSGKGIEITENEVVLPDGTKFTRDFAKTGDKVIIVPVISKNKILLTEFFSPINKKLTLRFPRGTINKFESKAIAAKRELLEETTYCAGTIKILPNSYYPNPGWNIESWTICVAFDLKITNSLKDKYENQKNVILDENKLDYKIKSGEIFDASTIVSYLIYNMIIKQATS